MTTTNIARIFVQNTFCQNRIQNIRSEVKKVIESGNVILYPSDSLIVFNFKTANEVSEVLNVLTHLGFPPAGDR